MGNVDKFEWGFFLAGDTEKRAGQRKKTQGNRGKSHSKRRGTVGKCGRGEDTREKPSAHANRDQKGRGPGELFPICCLLHSACHGPSTKPDVELDALVPVFVLLGLGVLETD